jgi:DNA-binding NarL/FixJ family response regulator
VDRARDDECRTRVSDFGLQPYELVVVDCELAGIDGKEFVRLLHNAREWRAIHLVALTNRISAPLAIELVQCIVYFQSTAMPKKSSIDAAERVKQALELNETVH